MAQNQFKIFFIGLFCLIISAVLVLNVDSLPEDSDYGYHTQNVASKINAQLKYIDNEAKKITKRLNEDEYLSFSNVVEPFKYPYFIFEENKIKYWSTHTVLPNYERLQGQYKYKLLEEDKNKYLIYRLEINKNNKKYELFFYIPLYHHYQIKNGYLESGFNKELFAHEQIHLSDIGIKDKYNVYAYNGEYLFSIVYDDNLLKDKSLWYALSFLLMLGGMILIGYFVYFSLTYFEKQEKYELGLLLLILSLLFVRLIMLKFNFPFYLVDWELFNPRFFAASDLSPTVGDLLLNHICMLLVVLFFFKNYRKSTLFLKFEIYSTRLNSLFSILLVTLSAFSMYFLFGSVKSIFLHSQEVLDISRNIEINLTKFIFILVFIILSLNFFVVNQVLARLFIKINKGMPLLKLSLLVVFCNIIMSVISYFLNEFNILISILSISYFGFIIKYKLPKTIRLFRYNTYLYFFLAALVCSLAGAIAIFEVTGIREQANKQRFSNSLLIDNDIQGEFLLQELSEKIANDGAIKTMFSTHLSDKEIIKQKIRKVYLNNYFDKYDIDIHLFNVLGLNMLINNNITFAQIKKNYNKATYKTQFENLYYVDESRKNASSRYVLSIDIDKDGIIVGHIVLDLKLKKVIPNSVYPELLVDEKFGISESPGEYSYAIYSENELLYTYGDFNYTDRFAKILFSKIKQGKESFTDISFEHLIIKSANNKVIVVSSPEYPLYHIFSNFSLLLLILLFAILLLIMFLSSYYNYVQNSQLSLSAKIQVYLNGAFFLPLFIVSAATLGIMSADYKTYINENFLEKVSRARVHLSEKLDSYYAKETSKEELNNLLTDLAKYSESDINIFDNRGKLIATSQPLIYQTGLLSGLLNPEAISKVIEQKSRTLMLTEEIGKFRYNTVYAAIKSSESGKMIGVVSIPYYHSKTDLERHLIEVLTGIIDIFTIVFIIFMGLSFVTARMLTEPLSLITQKIKKISFNDTNEPLTWNSKDEIGLLVGAYNKMLLKLVDSKKKLSQQEKESAWREMAQQVAHEIKNPLTPMKLSIQYLQRAIKDEREDLPELLNKSMANLLNQVDTLSDIATSFSAFAKMPIPINEQFEIVSLLSQTVDLYSNTESGKVILTLNNTDKINVFCDRNLMGRIISNLILNALQSVPKEREPIVEITLEIKKEKALITIKDNGSGIPDEIKEKVFMPNFSTKFTGSGIGLAVAKRGVEHAGGRIWFETSIGNGTSFFIELPLFSNT